MLEIIQLIAVGFIVFMVYTTYSKSSGGKNQKICKSCGTANNIKTETRGSLLIEIVLWLCFIVPGVIYSIWRHVSRRPVCAACGSPDLVPLNSPIGKKIAADYANTP